MNAQPPERVGLSSDLVVDVVLCGVFLLTFSLVAQHLQPDFPRVTLVAGLVGGGLCVAWGLLASRRPRFRVGALVPLVVMACVFAVQAMRSWKNAGEGESKVRIVALLMTLLVVFCAGTVWNLVRAGKKE
jgi:peptidoglycan/LPS O-acetylase OafA/YrhL